MALDRRELRIILQNALAHATKISIHNAKDKKVAMDEVFDLAKKIAIKVATIGEPNAANNTQEGGN